MARWKLSDPTINGERCWNIIVPQQQRERVAIDLGPELRMLGEGLELRAKKETSAGCLAAIVERLFTQPVAGEGQPALFPVPQGEGEHAGRALERWTNPPCLDRSEQGLRVGVTLPVVAEAGGIQLVAQLTMVVDLAVKHDHVSPAGRMHRLVSGRRKVDDRQAVERQRNAAFCICPTVRLVGPAMPQDFVHPCQDGADTARAGPVAADEACN